MAAVAGARTAPWRAPDRGVLELEELGRRVQSTEPLSIMLRSVTPATLVLQVESPIVSPVAAKPGDFLLVEVGNGRSSISVIRRSEADPAKCGALAQLVASGAVTPLDNGAAVKLAELVSSAGAMPRARRVRGHFQGGVRS